MEQDKRPRYKGICPECGMEMWICKSIFMEMGINQGGGRCLHCKTFLSIRFNEDKQEMELAKFKGAAAMEALEGICNEKLPDTEPGEPLLGEECRKAEKDASGKCKGYLIKGSREPFFACSICEEKAEDPEEEAESGQESGGNIGGHSAIGGHNMQNNGSRGAGGRDSAENGGRGAPA